MLAGAALIQLTSPGIFVNAFVHDLFVPLDGGRRVALGQRPHLDFFSPIGDLYYIVHGLAVWIIGADPRAVLVAGALMLPVTTGLVWAATRDRLPGLVRALVILQVGLLTISPRYIDDDWTVVAHLGSYNNWAWVGLTAAALSACIAPQRQSVGWDACALISALVLTFFLKLTFFVPAVLVCFVGFLLIPDNRRAITLGVSGGAVVTLAALVLTPGDLPDVVRAAQAVVPSLTGTNLPGPLHLLGQLLWGAIPLGMIVGLGVLTGLLGERRIPLLLASVTILMTLAGVQAHNFDMPGLIAPVCMGIAALMRFPDKLLHGFAALSLLFTAGPPVTKDLVAIGVARRALASPAAAPLSLDPDSPYARLYTPMTDPVAPSGIGLDAAAACRCRPWSEDLDTAGFRAVFQEGEAQLGRWSRPDDTVVVVSFSQWYTLSTVPARGNAAWWHHGRTFSQRSPPDPELALAEATLVLVPEQDFTRDNQRRLWAVWEPWVQQRFERVAATDLWQVWRRVGVEAGRAPAPEEVPR